MECLFEDQGTRLAMEQYISGAGQHANSEGLAQAVIDYWNSLGEDSESPALADRDLAPRTARERYTRTAYRGLRSTRAPGQAKPPEPGGLRVITR